MSVHPPAISVHPQMGLSSSSSYHVDSHESLTLHKCPEAQKRQRSTGYPLSSKPENLSKCEINKVQNSIFEIWS
jgi:hypothetical protein